MLQILLLVAPIFGLIVIGYLVAITRYLPEGSARIVSQFGYKVAMPALLFRAMLSVGDAPVSPMWLVATYVSGILTAWVVATAVARLVLRRSAVEAPSVAMAACFSNGVMLGFPIIIEAFGPEAATPIAFLAICETLFLWSFGTLHMEWAGRGARGFSFRALGGVVAEVLRNPLVVAMALGLCCRYFAVEIPALPMKVIGTIAQSAVPISLIGLGMALAGYAIAGQVPTITAILIIKMIAYPAVAFAFATVVFELPPLWAGALVTYVAMPVGANAFLFASRYESAVASVSASVAVSTVFAVVTITVILAVLKQQRFPVL